jgi:hypothetical protein
MRLAVSEQITVKLSKLGRLSAAGDGCHIAELGGLDLHSLLRHHCPDKMRKHLRALHAVCASGSRHASERTRAFWQTSLKAVLDAIQLMQGPVEMWGAIFDAEYYDTLPEWAREELGRTGQLNRDLRLMWRTGLSTDEAVVQLRALVAAEQRRREFAEVASCA